MITKKGSVFMNILAFESSCDETAAAVVRDGRQVLSDAILSQAAMHAVYGGVVPEIASRKHVEAIAGLADKALADAGLRKTDVDAVAVTYGPGLIGALLVGVNFAKSVAYALGRPLIPVHHLRGHIAANYITHPELCPPFLCLVVSGGHSHIVDVRDYCTLDVVARTRDDAAGEAFDKAARAMGIPYPGGVELDRIAEGGDPYRYALPRPRVEGSELDFSFSGLKTAALNLLNSAGQRGEEISVPDLCASYRRAVVEYLVDHFGQAVRESGAKNIAAAGGVSANRLLRRELEKLGRETGTKLYLPELKYCGDNAAMIAAQGYYEFLAGNTAGMELNAYATRDIGQTAICRQDVMTFQ